MGGPFLWCAAGLLAVGGLARADAGRDLGVHRGAAVRVAQDGDRHVVTAARLLPLSCAPVVAVLQDVAAFGSWIEVDEWRVLSARGAVPVRVYGRHAFPFPFAARDYVVDYTAAGDADGFVLTAVSPSGAAQSTPPPANGVVRLALRSTWRVWPDAAGCRVSYSYDGELGGSFPAFMLESVWRDQGPQLLEALLARARTVAT